MQEGKRVVVFEGTSQYGALLQASAGIRAELELAGLPCETVDLTSAGWISRLQEVTAGGDVRFFFSFQGWGVQINANNQPLCDKLNVPLVSLFGDHPAHHVDRLAVAAKNFIPMFTGNQHAMAAARFMPIKRPPRTIPIAFRRGPERAPSAKPRRYGLVLPGSWPDQEAL